MNAPIATGSSFEVRSTGMSAPSDTLGAPVKTWKERLAGALVVLGILGIVYLYRSL